MISVAQLLLRNITVTLHVQYGNTNYDSIMGRDIKMMLYHTKKSLPMVPTAKEEAIMVKVFTTFSILKYSKYCIAYTSIAYTVQCFSKC